MWKKTIIISFVLIGATAINPTARAEDDVMLATSPANPDYEPAKLPDPVDLSEFAVTAALLEGRLLARFQERGWVVSRWHGREPGVLGDSLLWSNVAMGALPCPGGQMFQEAQIRSLSELGGAYVRFSPLPDEYRGNEVSLDGLTGALFGVAMRAKKCPKSRAELASAWKLHREFVQGNRGALYPGNRVRLNPGIAYVWDLLAHEFGLADRPSTSQLRAWETALVSNAKYIHRARKACFPIHLGTLQAVTIDLLGTPISMEAKKLFCDATDSMDVPLTDWFCERGDIKKFLAEFTLNKWEYRHQRCAAWESADGDPNLETPGLDFLVAYRLAGLESGR